MRVSTLSVAAASVALAVATPIRRGGEDTINDMQDVISNGAPCSAVGAIFARGTFDSGNIGVWVGPDLTQSLQSKIKSVAVQGVDAEAYQATLGDYLAQGGSNAGAQSMAQTVKDYVSKCPNSAVVMAGWSQGALVAHKALDQLDSTTLKRVAGLVTFGDPWHLFSKDAPPIPGYNTQGYCVTGTDFDPLCADLPSDYKIPTSLSDILGPFKDLPSIAKGAEEIEAAASLVVQFPKQLTESWDAFTGDLNVQDFTKLLLTPQHFTYGNNGMADQAATWASNLEMVKAAQTS
jgi:Cutinase